MLKPSRKTLDVVEISVAPLSLAGQSGPILSLTPKKMYIRQDLSPIFIIDRHGEPGSIGNPPRLGHKMKLRVH